MSETLDQRLIRHEGYRHTRYRDTRGFWTIGCGHNLDAKGRMGIIPDDRDLDNEGITDEEIMALLHKDESDTMADLRYWFPWFDSLDSVRQDVLLDMCFNLGISHLLEFHHMIAAILAALTDGDYGPAADELKDSIYYHQVGDRAKENEAMLRTGVAV